MSVVERAEEARQLRSADGELLRMPAKVAVTLTFANRGENEPGK